MRKKFIINFIKLRIKPAPKFLFLIVVIPNIFRIIIENVLEELVYCILSPNNPFREYATFVPHPPYEVEIPDITKLSLDTAPLKPPLKRTRIAPLARPYSLSYARNIALIFGLYQYRKLDLLLI